MYKRQVLDIMLPKITGLEVLKELRVKSQIPVLMLTALDDESIIGKLVFLISQTSRRVLLKLLCLW